MKLSSQTSLIILAALVIAAGAYWYFFTGTEAPAITASAAQGNEAQLQFQTLVSELQPISFNTDIFSDPRFSALIDLATPVAPETVGRIDPFAPITNISGK